MVVHPKTPKPDVLYLIDQFVMSGRGAIFFVDPFSEIEFSYIDPQQRRIYIPYSNLSELFQPWGFELAPGEVVGDRLAARKVSIGGGQVVDYILWLALLNPSFSNDDVITANLERLFMHSSGWLRPTEENPAPGFASLVRATPQSMSVERFRIQVRPDPTQLLADFVADTETRVLAARVTGTLPSAFPDGPPGTDDAAEETEPVPADHRASTEAGHLVIVADSDVLADNVWVATREFFGRTSAVPTADNGSLDRATIEQELDETVAAVMVTVPNTLGLWEQGIEEVAGLIHDAGAYLYADGANLNAIMGRVRYGDLGFDVAHLNLHKSFSTPHGGGGPGAGPVCCTEELAPYLPTPVLDECDDGIVRLLAPERSIGQLQQFHGNVGVLLRAYAYLRALGLDGLRAVAGQAVLNANYLRTLLHGHYDLPYDRPVLHEVVFSGSRQRRQRDVRMYDIAKRLIDHGFHPPTVYFPLIVPEALMIEPTETEPPEAIEALADALIAIADEAAEDPDTLHGAPWSAPIGRLDETTAARRPVLRWQDIGVSESVSRLSR